MSPVIRSHSPQPRLASRSVPATPAAAPPAGPGQPLGAGDPVGRAAGGVVTGPVEQQALTEAVGADRVVAVAVAERAESGGAAGVENALVDLPPAALGGGRELQVGAA